MSTSTYYETTFVVSAKNTSPEVVESVIEKVKKIISKPQSQITLIENEGLKKLAYPIKGNREGYYVYCEYALSGSGRGETVSELENFLRINDSVIRYLTVIKPRPPKVKPRKIQSASNQNQKKTEESAAKEEK